MVSDTIRYASARQWGVTFRSPWVEQLAPEELPRPLDRDATTDLLIVGAGIAGVATAFFTLRDTDQSVLILEARRLARGASGHNAGQLATYFERPLCDLADEYGEQMAIEAQRSFDAAHGLLDQIIEESGASLRVDRFNGHMGMFTLNHLEVHLRNNVLRRAGGLQMEQVFVSEEAEFLDQIPAEFAGLYDVTAQAEIRGLLGCDDRYRAVLSNWKGCANSALLCEQAMTYLERTYPDRLRFCDHTPVSRIVVGGDEVTADANGCCVSARQVVLCTNGFAEHVVVDAAGESVNLCAEQSLFGTVGYMAGFGEPDPPESVPEALSFIRNERIGDDTPYVYVTRRGHDRPGGRVRLTCLGGPEQIRDPGDHYDRDADFPDAMIGEFDRVILPIAEPTRQPAGQYEYTWHGVMGYTPEGVRVIGRHPVHPELLYNIGCNGVGFLPSICGGERVARMVSGQHLPPSIFDPRL